MNVTIDCKTDRFIVHPVEQTQHNHYEIVAGYSTLVESETNGNASKGSNCVQAVQIKEIEMQRLSSLCIVQSFKTVAM